MSQLGPAVTILRVLPAAAMVVGVAACVLAPTPAVVIGGAALTCMAALMEFCGWSHAIRRATAVLGVAALAGALVATSALVVRGLDPDAGRPRPQAPAPVARR